MRVPSDPPAGSDLLALSQARPGDRGIIVSVGQGMAQPGSGVDPEELERRLLEFGFVEGAHIEVLHEGAIGHDPIVVRLDDMRVALRRADAAEVRFQRDAA